MRLTPCLFLLSLGLVHRAAAASPLLNRAAQEWLAEGDHWAFTVQVREWDGDEMAEERVERYDPSKPGTDRWELLAVDGQSPTPDRRLAWQKSKARKHRKAPKSLAEFFDFDSAKIVSSTPESISYLLPLRSNHAWLFPVERVALTVTVNKASHAIEEMKAGIGEPYRVALGLARIIDVDFNMKIDPSSVHGATVGPATAKPQGLAHVVISRLGKRIEYTWSEFRRVTPSADNASAPAE